MLYHIALWACHIIAQAIQARAMTPLWRLLMFNHAIVERPSTIARFRSTAGFSQAVYGSCAVATSDPPPLAFCTLVIRLTRTERIRPTALLSDCLNVENVVDMRCSTLNNASTRTHRRCALHRRRAIRSVCHFQSISLVMPPLQSAVARLPLKVACRPLDRSSPAPRLARLHPSFLTVR